MRTDSMVAAVVMAAAPAAVLADPNCLDVETIVDGRGDDGRHLSASRARSGSQMPTRASRT